MKLPTTAAALLLALPVLSCAVSGQAIAAESQGPSLEGVFSRVSDSVVTIRTVARTGILDDEGDAVSQAGVGSGVLISDDGKILTASHVVHTSDALVIEFRDGSTREGRVLGTVKSADVALVQVEGELPKGAVVAELGDSDEPRVGSRVFVVGAPLGITHSLTVGHLSARRELPESLLRVPVEFLQTDASINKGNSGGPMFDMSGRVMGIVSYIVSRSGGSEGLGFAVASNVCKRLLLERPLFWSGMEELLIGGELAGALNVPSGQAGMLVLNVAKGSAAERIGLRGGKIPATIAGQELLLGGDIIIEAFGERFTDLESIRNMFDQLGQLTPDKIVKLRVLRGGTVVELGGKVTDLMAP